MRFVVVLALAGCLAVDSDPGVCNSCPVSGPTAVTAPANDVFVAVRNGAMSYDVTGQAALALELGDCDYARYRISLGLGSAWFLVHPKSTRYCELWLGGETENPEYQGAPAQYCLFDRSGTLEIDMRRGGGPILLAGQPSCLSL
jgi:hypothetical protein